MLDTVDRDRKHEHPYRYAGLLVPHRQFTRPAHAHAEARHGNHEPLGQTADSGLTVHNDSHPAQGFDTARQRY
jgi:hypothetical protein